LGIRFCKNLIVRFIVGVGVQIVGVGIGIKIVGVGVGVEIVGVGVGVQIVGVGVGAQIVECILFPSKTSLSANFNRFINIHVSQTLTN